MTAGAATASRAIARAAIAAALLSGTCALAAQKIDEGFATGVTYDGRFTTPVDRITQARPGDTVIYWIQWKDHPVGHTTFRCRIVDDDDGEVLLDETQTNEDSRPEGYSTCGWNSHPADDPRSYTFSQYLDGEKVGEMTMHFTPASFWSKLSAYRQLKYALGALALAILGVHWWRKRSAGAADDEAAPPRRAISIGSNMAEPAQSRAKPEAAAPNPYETFKSRLAADPAARPDTAENAFAIAKAARSAGDPQLAVAALRGFDKAFPGHALIPEVFLFSAKLLAEDLNNREMARRILAHLLQKHPGHFVASEARRYLESLQTA